MIGIRNEFSNLIDYTQQFCRHFYMENLKINVINFLKKVIKEDNNLLEEFIIFEHVTKSKVSRTFIKKLSTIIL